MSSQSCGKRLLRCWLSSKGMRRVRGPAATETAGIAGNSALQRVPAVGRHRRRPLSRRPAAGGRGAVMTAAPTFDSQEAARSDEAPAPFRGRQLPFAPVALSVGERAAALRPLNHRPVPAPHPSSRRGQISVCESTGRHGPASFMTAAPRIQALAVTANRSGTTRQHPGGRGPGVPMGRRRRGQAGSSGLYCIPAVWRHRRRPLSRRLRVGGGRKDAAGGAASGPSRGKRRRHARTAKGRPSAGGGPSASKPPAPRQCRTPPQPVRPAPRRCEHRGAARPGMGDDWRHFGQRLATPLRPRRGAED
jgi:hypothetical protein